MGILYYKPTIALCGQIIMKIQSITPKKNPTTKTKQKKNRTKYSFGPNLLSNFNEVLLPKYTLTMYITYLYTFLMTRPPSFWSQSGFFVTSLRIELKWASHEAGRKMSYFCPHKIARNKPKKKIIKIVDNIYIATTATIHYTSLLILPHVIGK